MAEQPNNEQECDLPNLLDKENQSDSLEPTQTKRPSMKIQNPLQESQLCNLPTNLQDSTNKESGPLSAERTNKPDWLKVMGKKTAEKKKEKILMARSSPGVNVQETPRKTRSKATGKGHQSNFRKNMVQDLPSASVQKETANRGGSTESTKEEVNTKGMTSEEKGPICVFYKWTKKGIKHDAAGLNTPIIDFGTKTLPKANPSSKQSGYLFVCARKLNAIVNPWVPCGALEKGEILELELKREKSSDSSKGEPEQDVKIVAPEMCRYPTFHDGLFFKVKSQGKTNGGQTRKIVHKKQYYSDTNPMAVFGFPGQRIHDALQNDKRFIIPAQFSLEDSESTRHTSDVLLSYLSPSDTYTIVVHKSDTFRKSLPNETSAKKDLPNIEVAETSPLPSTSVPQPEPSVDLPDQPVFVSSPLSFKFSRDFQKFAKTIGQEKVESELVDSYRKNVQYKDPMMATTFRLLNQHLDNVALLRYNIGDESITGTLFLLTENLGLTCYHVVKLLMKSRAVSNVEVIFNYESEENKFRGKYRRVVWANRKLDCAFVCIGISPSPPGLLNHIAPPPEDGAVSIIGHPSGEYKQIDLNCSVIDFSQRADWIAGTIFSDRSYIHVLTQHNFTRMNDPTLATYDSCLYWGASGAPVFNSSGDLVAMHSGGYPATTHLKKKSVIEYGRNAVDIVIHGAIHIKEIRVAFRKLVQEKENLSKYLQPGGHPVRMQPVIRQLKKMWEESDKQTERKPEVDVSDRADSPMEVS